jgi:hypothetical protein
MLLVTNILCLLPSLSFVAFEQEVAPVLEALGAERERKDESGKRILGGYFCSGDDGFLQRL